MRSECNRFLLEMKENLNILGVHCKVKLNEREWENKQVTVQQNLFLQKKVIAAETTFFFPSVFYVDFVMVEISFCAGPLIRVPGLFSANLLAFLIFFTVALSRFPDACISSSSILVSESPRVKLKLCFSSSKLLSPLESWFKSQDPTSPVSSSQVALQCDDLFYNYPPSANPICSALSNCEMTKGFSFWFIQAVQQRNTTEPSTEN